MLRSIIGQKEFGIQEFKKEVIRFLSKGYKIRIADGTKIRDKLLCDPNRSIGYNFDYCVERYYERNNITEVDLKQFELFVLICVMAWLIKHKTRKYLQKNFVYMDFDLPMWLFLKNEKLPNVLKNLKVDIMLPLTS